MFSLAMIYAFSRWDSNTTATKFMKARLMSRIFGVMPRYESAHPRQIGRDCQSIFRDARRQQAEFLEVDVGQRILVVGQRIGIGRRLWNGEI